MPKLICIYILHTNYIKYWYDKDLTDWTTVWLEIPDGLENKITIYPEDENS